MIGQTIGNYRIVARLGGGGMGVVYSAEDTRLGRPVAVKFLSEEMARHPQALERFEREARAASALNHPNIATVYDVGTHEGRPYLVMELVEGESLDQKVRGRLLDTATLVDWAIQIADALDAAHAKGIVHRDVKPANLLVNARGQVKVLDFGLAKLAEAPAAAAPGAGTPSAAPTLDDLLTSPGMAVGTVSYMSPEQARGEELDARSDLFSLGCVLYEMATGGRAFTGKTPAVVFHAILQLEPAPVRETNPGAPAKLEEIIAKALEKERDLRYQTAAELRGDLRRLKRSLDSSRSGATVVSGTTTAVHTAPGPTLLAEDSPPSLWKRMLTPGGIARVVALAAVLGYRILISGGHAPASKFAPASEAAAPFSSFNITRLTATGDVANAGISRDGKFLAYVAERGGEEGLFLKQISTGSTVQLVPMQRAMITSPAFSPDDSFVYYVQQVSETEGSYYQIPSLGGAPRLVAAGIGGFAALSFDGSKIAYVAKPPGEEKAALLIAGIGERAEAPRAELRNVDASTIEDIAWSSDGQTLALMETDRNSSGLLVGVQTGGVTNGAAIPLGEKRWRFSFGGLAWLPNGSGVLLNAQERTGASSQVWYVSYPEGASRQLTRDLLDHRTSLSVTGDGKAFMGIQADIVSNLWTASKGEEKLARQITSGRSDGTLGMAWTADGQLIYASAVTGYFQLWLTDAQGSAPRQLTTDAAYHNWPAFCSGSDRAFFASDVSGPMQLWSAGLAGGQVRQETNSEEQFFDADCAPDGSWLAGLSAPRGTTVAVGSTGKVVRFDRESGQTRVLFAGEANAPAISPDGKHVAFLYSRAAPGGAGPAAQHIGVVSAQGGPLEKSIELPASSGFFVCWTPDGRSVVYKESRANGANLWMQRLNGGKPKQLTHFSEGNIYNFRWSRDGKFLALSRGSYSSDAVLYTSAK